MIPFPVYILFGALFTGAAAFACGRLIVHHAAGPLYREEERLLSFAAGSAVWSTLMFGFAAAHLVYKPVVLAAGVIAILLAARLPRRDLPPLPPLPRWVTAGACLLAAPFFVLYLSNAMAPELSPDGSAYHLGLVARYARERGFPWITTNMYANLSHGIEMLYLSAFLFGKHSAAAMVHFLFQAWLPLAMLTYARRAGFPVGGTAAALLVYLSPVIGIDGASGYNDVAVAAVMFAVFWLCELWREFAGVRLLVLIGILSGFAFACKYTAAVAAVYAGIVVLWTARRARPVVIVAIAAALVAAPWLVKNAIVVANPVSPFFNRMFPNPYILVSFEDEYKVHMRNYAGLKSHWEIPLEVTVRGHVLCGLLGPVWLFAPLALLGLRNPRGRRILIAALVYGSVYATNIGTRFLIPAMPLVALSVGLALQPARWVLLLLVVAHGITSWPDVLKTYCAQYAWRLDRIQWRPALRLESEDGFLRRMWPPYTVARMIEGFVPAGDRLLSFSQVAEGYTTREVLTVYQSAEGAGLGGIQWTPLIPLYAPTRIREFSFPERRLRRFRVVQTAAHAIDKWSITELRVYRGARELERAPAWRLRADPFPWTVQDAFDNSPVTRWFSHRPHEPGMYVEVDFGGEELADRVVIETPPDELSSQLRLNLPAAGSAWKAWEEARYHEREAPSPLGLRRIAAEELKRRNIRWLLIHENDYQANDYRTRQQDWGIRLMADTAGFYLYRIE